LSGARLQFKANIKLFDFLRTAAPSYLSQQAAILDLLGDYIPRSADEIRGRLDVQFQDGCAAACERMCEVGLLFRLGDSYFIEKTKMPRAEFVHILVERNIFTESQYRAMINLVGVAENEADRKDNVDAKSRAREPPDDSPKFPPSPGHMYPGIWDELIHMNPRQVYTQEECAECLRKNAAKIFAMFGMRFKTEAQKNSILTAWDPRIPPDIKRRYGLDSLADLDPSLFRAPRR